MTLRTAALATMAAVLIGTVIGAGAPPALPLRLTDHGSFEARGLDVLVFNNWYSGQFSDSKLSGVELIHHGVRTATNGDVRLSSTPDQWDPIPKLADRKADTGGGRVSAELTYPDQGLNYRIEVEASGDGVRISVRSSSTAIKRRSISGAATSPWASPMACPILSSRSNMACWRSSASTGLSVMRLPASSNQRSTSQARLPRIDGRLAVPLVRERVRD